MANQVYFSYKEVELFLSFVKTSLELRDILEVEIEQRAISKSRKTLNKKKTFRTGLDLYQNVELETEPNLNENLLDDSYVSEVSLLINVYKTGGSNNKKGSDYLFTTSTNASERDFRKKTTIPKFKKDGWINNVRRNLKTSNGPRKESNFIDKFYQPYVDKMHYNIALNQNISDIKKITREDAKINNYLEKKNKEVNKISHDLIIYNNPSKIDIKVSYKSKHFIERNI